MAKHLSPQSSTQPRRETTVEQVVVEVLPSLAVQGITQRMAVQGITQRIHVWYIYLHVVDFYDKCR